MGLTGTSLDAFAASALAAGASDLHIAADAPATVRVDGELRPLDDSPLPADSLRTTLRSLLSAEAAARLDAEGQVDVSATLAGRRFRLNVYVQRGTVAAALRAVPERVPTLASLSLPAAVETLTAVPRGVVLVTGATGSGKSTTLAAMVDQINRARAAHLITIEDPIEFVHHNQRSLVQQREVGTDTASFSGALRGALRQDPDVVLLGELRDLDTIETALHAAETGHLVLATLHTQSAAQTVNRLIDVFPAGQQEQIRTMLSSTLAGVVAQELLPLASGTGRVAACEVLVVTDAVRNLVRTGKVEQLDHQLQTGGAHGMQSLDQSLGELVASGAIAYEAARRRARSTDVLNSYARRR